MTDLDVLLKATRRVITALKTYEKSHQRDGLAFSEREMAIYIRTEYRRMISQEKSCQAA